MLLIDASVQMGVCASMLDLRPTASISDAVRQQHRLDETLIRQLATPHPSGLHLLAAPDNPMEGAEMDDEICLADPHARPPRLPIRDRRHLPHARPDQRLGVGPERPAPTWSSRTWCPRSKARRDVAGAGQPGLPPPTPPDRTQPHDVIAGSLRPADVVRRLGHNVDHVLPFDKKVIVSANTGDPIVLHAGRFSGYSRPLRELIDDVESVGQEEPSAGDVFQRAAAGGR